MINTTRTQDAVDILQLNYDSLIFQKYYNIYDNPKGFLLKIHQQLISRIVKESLIEEDRIALFIDEEKESYIVFSLNLKDDYIAILETNLIKQKGIIKLSKLLFLSVINDEIEKVQQNLRVLLFTN